jgi:hypothetical protein
MKCTQWNVVVWLSHDKLSQNISFVFLVLLFIKVTYGLLSHKVELKSWWENWVAILLEQLQF